MSEFLTAVLNLFNPEKLLLFALVLTRVSGLVMIAPIYGSRDVPMRVRALLAFSLSLLIAPMPLEAEPLDPGALLNFLTFVGSELVIGYFLGLGVWLFFSGLQLAGQLIAQVSGMALADVLNPALGGRVPLAAQMLYLFATAIFLIIGGHRVLMAGLLDTFVTLPVGSGISTVPLTETLLNILTQSFSLGIRVAAPVTAALLLSTLVMGLIGRTLPQLNILMLSFGVNSMVSLSVLAFALGAISWTFQDQLQSVMETLFDAVGAAPQVRWFS